MVIVGSKRTALELDQMGLFRIAQGNSVIELSPEQASAVSEWVGSMMEEAKMRYTIEESYFPFPEK
jgi:hypothetical protein